MKAEPTFSQLLKQYQRKAACTQSAIAKQVGYNRSSVSLWMSGKLVPSLRAAKDISAALGLDFKTVSRAIKLAKVQEKYPDILSDRRHDYAHRPNSDTSILQHVASVLAKSHAELEGEKMVYVPTEQLPTRSKLFYTNNPIDTVINGARTLVCCAIHPQEGEYCLVCEMQGRARTTVFHPDAFPNSAAVYSIAFAAFRDITM